MPITKKDVLEILDDPTLHAINFSIGALKVNSDEYDRVYWHIENDLIDIDVRRVEGADNLYFPQADKLVISPAEPPLKTDKRAGILHECTHIISDINKVTISVLNNEVAAYLAQVAYVMLKEPDAPELISGSEEIAFARIVRTVVKNYSLTKSQGYGAKIAPADVDSLAGRVNQLRPYRKVKPTDMAIEDGVEIIRESGHLWWKKTKALSPAKLGLKSAEDTSMRSGTSAHENWTTSDDELGALLRAYKAAGASDKAAVLRRLTKIFQTVTQKSADALYARLSVRQGADRLSTLFNEVLPPGDKTNLLSALKLQR